MGLISCKKLLSVGVQQFDDEHSQLVAFVNELHEEIKSGTGTESVRVTLQQLLEFAQQHFQAEEMLLMQHEYPDLHEHQLAHREILRRLSEIQADCENAAVLVNDNIMQFLLDWLISHTKVVDKRYGCFLNSKGVY